MRILVDAHRPSPVHPFRTERPRSSPANALAYEFHHAHGGERLAALAGFIVLSDLGPGNSRAYSRTLSVKLVLEGEEVYEVGDRSIRVGSRTMLLVEAPRALDCRVRQAALGLCTSLPETQTGTEGGQAGGGWGSTSAHGLVLSTETTVVGRFLRGLAVLLGRPEGSPRAPDPRRVMTFLNRALPSLVERSADRVHRLGGARSFTGQDRFRRVEAARAFLADHRARAVSLAEVARASRTSQFQLARDFAAAYAETPMSFHRRQRMTRAWWALRRGHTPSQVAELVGFPHLRTFSRAFKSVYGCPPSAVVPSATHILRKR